MSVLGRGAFPERLGRRSRRETAGAALLLFGVAFALRALYALLAVGPGATPSSDPAEYDQIAWNLARGAGFSLGGPSGVHPTAFVPPLLPWVVSLLYRAAGHHFFAAVMLQCAIGALVPLAIDALGAAMFGGSAGRIAGWLAALNPLAVFFSGYLLTETLFSLVLAAALLASVEWVKTPRPARALGVGLLWGVAALARPPALLLPWLIVAWALVPLGLTLERKDRARQVLLLALGFALVLGPWTIRNAFVFHRFVPLTTGGGRALLDSNNPEVWGNPALRGGANSTYDLEPYATEFRGLDEAEADARARRRALDFLRAHASEWPAMALAKLARFWRLTTEAGTTGSWQRAGSPLALALKRLDPLLIWSVLTLPFALWGLARSLSGPRRWFQALPALVILFFSLGAVAFWGALRMRVPIEPLTGLLAAVGFEDARRRWKTGSRGMRVIEGRRKAG